MPQPETASERKLEIGLRVKEAREAISMSQEEFSKLMGKSGRHWAWKVEAGQIWPVSGADAERGRDIGAVLAVAHRRPRRGVRGGRP